MSKYLHGDNKPVFAIFIFALCCFLTACYGTEVGNPQTSSHSTSGNMQGFNSNEELEVYLKDQYTTRVFTEYPYGLDDMIRMENPTSGVDDGGGFGDGSEAPSTDSSDSYTDTNVQESGVDEADVLKTDGNFIYIAGEDRVSVVRIEDPMKVIGMVRVKGKIDSMYLYKELLVVLYTPLNFEGSDWITSSISENSFIGIPYWIPIRSKTGLAFFNVGNPAEPKEVKTLEADGYLISSRRIENRMHIVQQFLPDLPSPENLETEIDNLGLEELIPYYAETTGSDTDGTRRPVVTPADFYHPDIDGGGSIVTIVTFDLDALDKRFTSIGVVADASIVYASTQALYCTSTFWNRFVTTDTPLQQTLVYKFDLSGEKVLGRGYTSVSGRVLNQFSLGEHDNVLRIATTTGWVWEMDATSKNHVFCLASQNNKLEIIGRLNDLAPGEELYAARFIDTRGFLVTFVTIDPLFTIDLSDPKSPRVAGELKVPGYSNYIHPLGDDHLLTIGKYAEAEDSFAWYQGVQLSIFDISDFAHPRLLHAEIIGDRGTHSEALYNHKAFTFWAAKGLLAIPIDLYEHLTQPEYPWTTGTHTFSGLYVYRVGVKNGFKYTGNISTLPTSYPSWFSHAWTRGVFVDNRVFAVTPEAVHVADIEDMAGTVQTLVIGDAQK